MFSEIWTCSIDTWILVASQLLWGPRQHSSYYLVVANGGSFLHKSPAECREILDNIMMYTDFTVRCETLQEERKSSQEKLLAPESNPSPSTSSDSAIEPSPEPRTLEKEEIQPSMFSSQFKDDPSGSNKNTSNFFDAQLGEEPFSVHTNQSKNL